MAQMNSWINSMWMIDDADPNSDVSISLTVSAGEAQQLALGDCVSISHDVADAEPPTAAEVAQAEAEGNPVRLRGCRLPSPSVQRTGITIPPLRPEVPAFQPATDHEIGIACNKGLTYQYAYPKGATPADACRWSHVDETEVREELWDIKPGDIVYDLGSAFGSYALTALAMGAAHVVCFNPNPQEQDLLLASARLNGWGDKITRHNVGLWDEVGYLNDEEQTFTKTAGEFKVTKTADGRHTQLFAVRSLDSMCLVEWCGRGVAKLDVEGAEVHVLRGARAFFAQAQPAFVLIEKHVFKDATLDARTDEAMAELGYVLVTNRPYHSVVHALYRMKGWDD